MYMYMYIHYVSDKRLLFYEQTKQCLENTRDNRRDFIGLEDKVFAKLRYLQKPFIYFFRNKISFLDVFK